MMSLSAASDSRRGGTGAIRTDITITVITRTLTMDPAIIRTVTMDTVGTPTAMATADTVTTVVPVMGIVMEAERIGYGHGSPVGYGHRYGSRSGRVRSSRSR